MSRKICVCGRAAIGLSPLCPKCLDARRRERAARPVRYPVLERIDESRRPAHLAWIRTLPCAVPGCRAASEAAHVRMVDTGGGMGLKPADWWTVPLCHHHHIEDLHRTSHVAFDAKHGTDLHALAQDLAARSPYLTQEEAA